MRDEIFNILERYGDWYAENYVPTLPHERQLSGEQALSRIMELVEKHNKLDTVKLNTVILELESENEKLRKEVYVLLTQQSRHLRAIKNPKLLYELEGQVKTLKAKLQPKLDGEVYGAIARAWCHKENSHKVFDPDLANAVFKELDLIIPLTPPSQEKCPSCNGHGSFFQNNVTSVCEKCNGTGKI